MVHTSDPSAGDQKDQKFKTLSDYTGNWRSAWSTKEVISKDEKECKSHQASVSPWSRGGFGWCGWLGRYLLPPLSFHMCLFKAAQAVEKHCFSVEDKNIQASSLTTQTEREDNSVSNCLPLQAGGRLFDS